MKISKFKNDRFESYKIGKLSLKCIKLLDTR